MLRKLPSTITADQTPDWLPAGWIAHSTVLKRGRQTWTYTHLRTRKRFSTKDQVLEFIKMDKIREERESGIVRKKANLKDYQDRETAGERPPYSLSSNWKPELRSGSHNQNPYVIFDNMLSGFNTHSKQEVQQYQNTMESEASLGRKEETGIDYISYDYDMDEEDWSENDYVADESSRDNLENFSDNTSTSLRSLPERMQKLESRAITQCIFEDEEMSSDSEDKLQEAKTSKEENAWVVPNLHGVVVECDDKAREIPGLTGSFSIEINLEIEPESDSLIEKNLNKSETEGIRTRNIEIRDQDSDLMHTSKVVEEPLKAQAVKEETVNGSRRSILFPYREAPSHSVFVFDKSTEDLSNTIGLDLNPHEKNISGSKKQKNKNMKRCSYKNIKKKDNEAPTKKLEKGKKGSSSAVMEKKKAIDWPEPCPNFPFEPITSSILLEDDSVIRRYLEQHFTAAGSADSNLPLPDFGLPSFSNIKISVNEEPQSHDPLASSSLPSCSSMGTSTTMQQTVAGN